MVNAKSLGTRDVPLQLAKQITDIVRKEWEEGVLLEKVTPITKDLLRFWDPQGGFGELRTVNFHQGQWQAILNTVYMHEVLKVRGVSALYQAIKPELLQELDLLDLKKDKHEHPKYCIKMATGTGKTWVLSALVIWQYLNAKHEEERSGLFSKNFLLVAPGIIVYERLLDAFLGKRRTDGSRDVDTSDLQRFGSLFLPPSYKEDILGFVQSNVVQKEEIGRKVTGEGMIAITNWHLLVEENDSDDIADTALDAPERIVKKLLPITPGTSAGHSLEELDTAYLRGKEVAYLAELPDLVAFNDEAHHLGEFKKSDEVLDKKWQKALDTIAIKKKERFIQADFSATPYTVTGSGLKRSLHYFPHIIVNFELVEAIKLGLVKTVAIDKRKEVAALPLEFKAERESGDVKGLSDGQRVMLRAGFTKLRRLEEGFCSVHPPKHPKMLVVCEDTTVVPHVIAFLKQEGYADDELMEIHSTKKGDIGEEEWKKIKQRLFEVDNHATPKIMVSVLMLREGFDVNNICVIVPLRASSSYILLEQTIGRGLRLMWRDPVYEDIKQEIRENLLIKKIEPPAEYDILSIIEHPAFIEFYERVLGDALGKIKELPKKERVVGDIISIGLKPDYQAYDLFWPLLLHDKEEELVAHELSLAGLEQFPIPLEELMPLVNQRGDIFKSEELTVKTKFGEYAVTADIFTAQSYNSFIQKIVSAVSEVPVKVSKNKTRPFPIMQINSALIARLTDEYIRTVLFGKEFDPLHGNHWRILLLTEARIIQHIVKNVAKTIYDLHTHQQVHDATVVKRFFSEVVEMKIRESCALSVAKTIYSQVAFPSNKGGFEKAFIQFIDTDSQVKAFMKINEHVHDFATVVYVRDDGLLAHYYPDFMVRIGDNLYLVETKAERDLNDKNVTSKRLATCDWVDKINQLLPEQKMHCMWHYVLLGEKTFYSMSEKGGDTKEILEYAKKTKAQIKGTLGDYLGIKEY